MRMRRILTGRTVRWAVLAFVCFVASVVGLTQMASASAPWNSVLLSVAAFVPFVGAFALARLAAAIRPIEQGSKILGLIRGISLFGMVTMPFGFIATAALDLKETIGLTVTVTLWSPALVASVLLFLAAWLGERVWQAGIVILLTELVIALFIRWFASVQYDDYTVWGTTGYMTRAHAGFAAVTSSVWAGVISIWGIWQNRDEENL